MSTSLRRPRARPIEPAAEEAVRGARASTAVEPEDAPRGRPCEQCAVVKIGRGKGDGYKPTYLWEGSNYLLKMLHDLDFLHDVETLKEFLGPEFNLKRNPLLLAPELESGDDAALPALDVNDTNSVSSHMRYHPGGIDGGPNASAASDTGDEEGDDMSGIDSGIDSQQRRNGPIRRSASVRPFEMQTNANNLPQAAT